MAHVQTHRAPDGCHIVQNSETGERYIRTPDAKWKEWLDAWRKEVGEPNPLLERLFRRAVRVNSWTLYTATKRALTAKRMPAPMPWGHIMFRGCKKPSKAA